MGSGGGHSTDFSSKTLEKLKAMVRDAQPDKVDEIADHWMHVHDQMAKRCAGRKCAGPAGQGRGGCP